jgi:hypothetical protein
MGFVDDFTMASICPPAWPCWKMMINQCDFIHDQEIRDDSCWLKKGGGYAPTIDIIS